MFQPLHGWGEEMKRVNTYGLRHGLRVLGLANDVLQWCLIEISGLICYRYVESFLPAYITNQIVSFRVMQGSCPTWQWKIFARGTPRGALETQQVAFSCQG